MANLSHVVGHLSFGPTVPMVTVRRMSIIPTKLFSYNSSRPMDENIYRNTKLHQAFHHYLKVVPTNLELGKDTVLVYQMVSQSQIMTVSNIFTFLSLLSPTSLPNRLPLHTPLYPSSFFPSLMRKLFLMHVSLMIFLLWQ